MADLSKADVERLLAAVDQTPAELREALTTALRVVLERDGDWADLVAGNGWPESRVNALRADDQDALWDLAAELNELRHLAEPPGGREQREAVSAIERAIKAVGQRDSAAIRKAAASIGELDRAGVYRDLPLQLQRVADAFDGGTAPDLQGAVDALGPGPLAAELQSRLSD
jgi:hypothetical protein